jgi:hypothetical protein
MRINAWRKRLDMLQVRAFIHAAVLTAAGLGHAQFEQPGTQPNEHDFQFREGRSPKRADLICAFG